QGKTGYEKNLSGATDQNKSSFKDMYARNIWGHDVNVDRLEWESNRSGEPPQWILEFKDRIVVIENGELVDEKIK
ncbi:MAG: zf-HC2 domain-containing protein, partial [Roseburia sp.]|nr:zf-HC2 domain-containing protein [Roseburia sp.]